jgi:multidrug efflux pump
MGDIVGRLFREFAVTLSVTILMSAIVSLTLTPMMSARLLKHTSESTQGRLFRMSENAFNAVIAFYGKTLKFVLRFQTITLLVAVATLALTVFLFYEIPKGFFPIQDTGVVQAILRDPAVESLSSFIGIDGTNTTMNSGRIQINLRPLNQRKIGASDVIRRLQPGISQISGITLYMQPVQDLTVDDRVSRTQFQYTLESPNADELNAFAPKMLAELKQLPELADVASDQQTQGIQARLVIDRPTASRFGITSSTIDQTLYDAYGQREVSTMFTQLNQYHVVLEVDPKFDQRPLDLRNLYIRTAIAGGSPGTVAGGSAATSPATSTSVSSAAAPSTVSASPSSTLQFGPTQSTTAFPNGGQIPLSAFTQLQMQSVPIAINHQGQFPVITLSFNLAPNASLGAAMDAVSKAKDSLNMPLSIQGAFQGTAAAFANSLSNEPVLILAALITVYLVLGVLYESYIHPITILSSLPSAGVGALLALNITGNDFSVIALIGVVLLIGIVKKNAIMMIDFALEAEREQHLPPLEAIYQASLLRFRPIMMTTMAALLGGVPLAFGSGTGSELRRPLGITIVGGLILSQLLTLYTTPVIYLFFDRLATRFGHAPEKQRAGESAPQASTRPGPPGPEPSPAN